MKLTCVLSCHNEEEYLPYSLVALRKLPVDELIVVLDRCRDESKHIIQIGWHKALTIYEKNKTVWQNPCAEAKNVGCTLADHGLIFMTDADIIASSNAITQARKLFDGDKTLQIVAFTYKQYSLDGTIFQRFQDELNNLFSLVSQKLRWQPGRSGIYMVKSGVAKLEDEASEYDSLQLAHKTVELKTNFLHLRPRYGHRSQFDRGKARAHMPQYSLFKILLASLLTLQPHLLLGYLTEKRLKQPASISHVSNVLMSY